MEGVHVASDHSQLLAQHRHLGEGWLAAPTGTHAQAARCPLRGEEPAQPAAPTAAQPATDSAADSADEVELAREVDMPADAGADAPATEDADEAFQQLTLLCSVCRFACKNVAHCCHTAMS
jgi:hypothetical protein